MGVAHTGTAASNVKKGVPEDGSAAASERRTPASRGAVRAGDDAHEAHRRMADRDVERSKDLESCIDGCDEQSRDASGKNSELWT